MLGCLFQPQNVIKIHISYGVRLSASRPTPTWRTRASHLVWVITLTCLAWVALLEVCYRQDSSQYHMTMQAQIQYCHYCPYWHLLERLREYIPLVQGLGCEMSLMHVSFMPIKVAKGWPRASFQHSSQLPSSPRANPLHICLLATEQTKSLAWGQ